CEGKRADAAAGPDMRVMGNGYLIHDGDSSPAVFDLTDFETVEPGERSDEHFFTIYNAGDSVLELTGSPAVQIIGGDSDQFKVRSQPKTQLDPNESTSFAITFEPDGYGRKTATVVITSNDSDHVSYSFDITGYGGYDDDDDDNIHFYGSCELTRGERGKDGAGLVWMGMLALSGALGIFLSRLS
ncbi:MAG: choice-of-anchor D domain-containing protein, partial [Lentisphaerae bacterium]